METFPAQNTDSDSPEKKNAALLGKYFIRGTADKINSMNKQVKEVSHPTSVRKSPVPPYAFGGSCREGDLTG